VRVSASIRCRCLFAPRLLVLSHARGTRRPSPNASKSGEMEAFASLRQTPALDFCNDSKKNARARPRASDPRPLRREGVSARVVASAPASRSQSFDFARHATAPLSREERAASQPASTTCLSNGRKPVRVRTPRTTALRYGTCEVPHRIHRRLRRGWLMQWRNAVLGRRARSEGPTSPS